MIDITTLEKLKNADKALDICRLELVKMIGPRGGRINFSRLYQQHQIGWSIIGQILQEVDPAYIKRKRDRARNNQRKRHKKDFAKLNAYVKKIGENKNAGL